MTIDEIVMPDWIRAETLKILEEIGVTEGTIEMERIKAIADGFGTGLSGIGVLTSVDLDELEILLGQAINRRTVATAVRH